MIDDILTAIQRKFHHHLRRNMKPATRLYLGEENFAEFKNAIKQHYMVTTCDIRPLTYCDAAIFVVVNDPKHLEVA